MGAKLQINYHLTLITFFVSLQAKISSWPHQYGVAEVDRWTGFLPWSVQEMPKTGNLLITGRKGLIQEINRQGQTVWHLNTTDYGVTQPQKTVRLKDGGHMINNRYNEWNKEPMDTANAPVQAIEIEKDGLSALAIRMVCWCSPSTPHRMTWHRLRMWNTRLIFRQESIPIPAKLSGRQRLRIYLLDSGIVLQEIIVPSCTPSD